MVFSFFDQVKEAFASDPEGSCRMLGINLKQTKGEWMQAQCPHCSDQSGSASISSKTGYLKCHQCQRKQDLFDWTSELWGTSPWEACQKLCGEFRIDLAVKRPGGAHMPRALTRATLRAGTLDLWTKDEAEPIRRFLRDRKLDDPQLLEQFGVIYLKGQLVFAQFDYFNGGALRPVYRSYRPNGRPKWLWTGTGEKGGFWPYWQVPDDGEIWICEGEWDVKTAWMRLRLQEQGIFCFTWTSTGKIPGHRVPDAWHGKKVTLLYDNDTWQGADVEPRAPSAKQLAEQEGRLKKLKSHAAGFYANNCETFLRHIPINPLENYGADLRDWVDAGNTDISKLGGEVPFKDFTEREKPPREISFHQVSGFYDQRVKFSGLVDSITAQDRTLPTQTCIDCEMGNAAACRNCLVPGKFPQQMIWWKDYPRELAQAMLSKNFEAAVKRDLLGVPRNCPRCTMTHEEPRDAALWTAVLDTEESVGKEIVVVSHETPTLSGEVEVDGYVYHWREKNTHMVMAKDLRQLDKAQVDLTLHLSDLKALTPEDDDLQGIDDYIHKRAGDLAYNVTKIHGRDDVHIAHDLLMHSAIGYQFNDMPQRGWLDMGIVGDTRTGKTEVFRQLFHWHGIGSVWAAMSGITQAGLTMGAQQSYRGYVLRPGLFPRSHKKVLVLDEFHIFNQDREHPIVHLQSARDKGHCDSIKISGSRSLPAAVRFCTISNWPNRRGRFPCSSFLQLYQKPECLSRTDFMLVVDSETGGPVPVPAEWTAALAQTMILRAWAMDPSLVEIDPAAIEAAREFTEECRGVYSERIPLFTPEASFYSVLRIAIACANLCFSYAPGNYYACRVRRGHVLWACRWLRHTWELSQYDRFSANEEKKHQVLQAFEAEHMLTMKLGLDDPSMAPGLLENFLGSFRESEIPSLTGFEQHDAVKWFAKMRRLNVFSKDEALTNYAPQFEATRGGEEMLRNIIRIAEEHPEEYRTRMAQLKRWAESGMRGTPSNLEQATLPFHVLVHDQDRQQGEGGSHEADEVPF